MAEYDNTNQGALFKNDKKESEKHPDYRGSINVDGTDFWLSAWIKESKKGGKFMSLSVTAKDGKPKGKQDDDGSDIPF
jgi:uncharacterized protein (DUF736 family)